MAKRSIVGAIRNKSKAVYPTAGTKPVTLLAIHKLAPKGFAMANDEELERKYIHGGYKNKKMCPTCFVRYSVTGACNCE